jgi:5-methylcytosine-specific restriction endonuclease McrA
MPRNWAKRQQYLKDYHEKNKEQINKQKKKNYDDKIQNAYNSITLGEIIDQYKWDMWCNQIKRGANKHPYSIDFTNEIIFEMMVQGCFYCGNIAMTIDRIDSNIDHTIDNCIGSCYGCNNSKGVADILTFVRKAYYRARHKYMDNINDIWFINENQPSMWHYSNKAKKQKVPFDLSKENFESMLKKKCEYCYRTPSTWFGIDRIIPSLGYVLDNVVTSCFDCNLDKHNDDINTMIARNERIAKQIDAGKFVDIDYYTTMLHLGIQKMSKKVCAHGKVYINKTKASKAIGMCRGYVNKCIDKGRHPDEIFDITDEFYEEYKDSDNITKDMFIAFNHFYTNM